MLLYVDDVLYILKRYEHALCNGIGKYLYIKYGSILSPTIYMEDKLSKVTLENGVYAQSFSSSQHAQAAVTKFEQYLK